MQHLRDGMSARDPTFDAAMATVKKGLFLLCLAPVIPLLSIPVMFVVGFLWALCIPIMVNMTDGFSFVGIVVVGGIFLLSVIAGVCCHFVGLCFGYATSDPQARGYLTAALLCPLIGCALGYYLVRVLGSAREPNSLFLAGASLMTHAFFLAMVGSVVLYLRRIACILCNDILARSCQEFLIFETSWIVLLMSLTAVRELPLIGVLVGGQPPGAGIAGIAWFSIAILGAVASALWYLNLLSLTQIDRRLLFREWKTR